MRRLVALILLCLGLAALPAGAVVVRGRPISTLRMHGRLSPLRQPSIATDGRRFLVVYSTFSDAFHRNYVWAQLAGADGTSQPPLLLGRGSDPAVVWTGQQYVVVWSGFLSDGVGTTGGVLRRAVIARGGALRDSEVIVSEPLTGTRMAWNGKRILVVATAGFQRVTRLLLDRHGRAAGDPLPFPEARGSDYWSVVAAFGRYYVGFTGGDESVVMVREDGEVMGSASLPLGSDAIEGAFAFDGKSLLFAYATVRRLSLNVIPVHRDGSLGTPAVVLRDTALEAKPRVPYAAFDGTRLLLAYTLEDSVSGRDAAIVGIDGEGRVVMPVVRVALRDGNQAATGLACAGTRCAVVIGERDRGDDAGTLQLVDRTTSAAAESVALGGPLLDAQQLPTIAASRGAYLLAWWEDEDTVRRLYASRIAPDGSFLDGAGIVLASLPIAAEPQRPAIASDGDGWLVVWSDARVRGARISPAGEKLDEQPIEIMNGTNPAVAWNGSAYLVVAEQQTAIPIAFVGRDGRLDLRAPFIPAGPGLPHRPALTWDGRYFMLAYVMSSTPLEGTQLATRLDDAGTAVDGQPIAIGSAALPLAAASDGQRYCFTSDGISTAPVGDPRRISRTDFYGYQAYFDGRVARRPREFTTVFSHIGEEVLIFPTDGSPQRLLELSGLDEVHSPDVACIGESCAVVYTHTTPTEASQRVELVFAHEVSVDAIGTLPEPPHSVRTGAAGEGRMLVEWEPVEATGYEIETSTDGLGYRRVEVAPGNATSATVPAATFVRVRAANGTGVSAPSSPAVFESGCPLSVVRCPCCARPTVGRVAATDNRQRTTDNGLFETIPRMPSKIYKTTIYRDGSMCFIPVPFDPKPVFGKVRAPVKVTVNGYTYRSTIAAMGGTVCIPLRKSNREAAGLEGDETVEVRLDLDTEKREVTPPADLVKALKAALPAWDRWQELPFTHQREYVEAIEEAKKPETRTRRIAEAVKLVAARKERRRTGA